ncbi:MAG: sugar ABC transporter permease [Myxococcota bacterium]|nr:sugar ABC transporter permease [Myxococcota bacterium]
MPTADTAQPLRALRVLDIEPSVVAIALALLLVALGFDRASDGIFLTPRNLTNLAVQSSVVGIMATGMVLVIGARHIDLAVGSAVGFAGMLAAVAQTQWLSAGVPSAALVAFGVGAALVSGIGIGLWQGYWVAYRAVPAFVVTLAGLLVFRGAAYLLTDGRTIAPLDPAFEMLGGGIDGSIGATWSWLLASVAVAGLAYSTLSRRRERQRHGIEAAPIWADALRFSIASTCVIAVVAVMNAYTLPRSEIPRGLPLPVLFLIAAWLGVDLLARRTPFGRYAFAIGDNPDAAALSGVPIARVTVGVFALMGALAGLAGALTAARLGAGASSMGTLQELNVIAAVVIGGTSLRGGSGSVGGAVLGAVFMQSLENGMVLLDVSTAMRQVCIGLVLLFAVWLDSATRKRRIS